MDGFDDLMGDLIATFVEDREDGSRCFVRTEDPRKANKGEKLRSEIEKAVGKLVSGGSLHFAVALESGIDVMVAETISSHRGATYYVFHKGDGHHRSWSREWSRRYESALGNAIGATVCDNPKSEARSVCDKAVEIGFDDGYSRGRE